MYNSCYYQRVVIRCIYIFHQFIQKLRYVAIFRWNIIRISRLGIIHGKQHPGRHGSPESDFLLGSTLFHQFLHIQNKLLGKFFFLAYFFLKIIQSEKIIPHFLLRFQIMLPFIALDYFIYLFFRQRIAFNFV